MMASWIQNCQICNDGLCIRMEELKKTNLSERQAAEIMQEEAYDSYPDMKEQFSANRIRDRYRYHMKGKKVGEFPPQKAQWPMCKKCGLLPVHNNSFMMSGPAEPAENGLCGKCGVKEQEDQKPKCQKCGGSIQGEVYKHGLCKICRGMELKESSREDANNRLEERQKEFDQTPVAAEVDKNWLNLIIQWEQLEFDEEAICGKVGEETLEQIKGLRHLLFRLIEMTDKVIAESEVSARIA